MKSVNVGKDVTRKNVLLYVAATEEYRKGIAERTYYGEINSLGPFYRNYSQGKMPTYKELSEYNKIKHTNYEMWQIKRRLSKIAEYEKSGNPDCYVKPRRKELLLELPRSWKGGQIDDKVK